MHLFAKIAKGYRKVVASTPLVFSILTTTWSLNIQASPIKFDFSVVQHNKAKSQASVLFGSDWSAGAIIGKSIGDTKTMEERDIGLIARHISDVGKMELVNDVAIGQSEVKRLEDKQKYEFLQGSVGLQTNHVGFGVGLRLSNADKASISQRAVVYPQIFVGF